VGAPPSAAKDSARHMVQLATDVIRADADARQLATPPSESALSALLRAIDTTTWTIDPLGTTGTEPVAGLVGRPIAVARMTMTLDVPSDAAAVAYSDTAPYDDTADHAARDRRFADLADRKISVRIGELTRTDDGVLGWVADGADRSMHVVAPEVRSEARDSGRGRGHFSVFGSAAENAPEKRPIDHPYISEQTQIFLHANHRVRLTLLLAPGTRVYATSGILPRKSLALARDWTHPTIEHLAPSFRIGPVLVDPTTVRMPKVSTVKPSQSFIRRTTPIDWRDDPIAAATQTALLPDDPSGLEEGWIRVRDTTEGTS
jgi:hypothetical protein